MNIGLSYVSLFKDLWFWIIIVPNHTSNWRKGLMRSHPPTLTHPHPPNTHTHVRNTHLHCWFTLDSLSDKCFAATRCIMPRVYECVCVTASQTHFSVGRRKHWETGECLWQCHIVTLSYPTPQPPQILKMGSNSGGKCLLTGSQICLVSDSSAINTQRDCRLSTTSNLNNVQQVYLLQQQQGLFITTRSWVSSDRATPFHPFPPSLMEVNSKMTLLQLFQ